MCADLASQVRVKAKFQRSVRLDTDFDQADALDGYILQASARHALEVVARHVAETQQRAFTWTGPYGGGKSSLALALAVLAGREAAGRRKAREILRVNPNEPIAHVFGSRKPWLVLPVVGRRVSVEDAIGDALDENAPLRGRRPMRDGRRDIIAELTRRADATEHGGVLLILDELGKFLEAAASTGDDIFFYQELAEAASRSNGRLVVVGVLHQAFEQYASRLGREVREEWAKVQGRYVDIPIVAGTDEVLDLIGRAIETTATHPKSQRVAKHVAATIQRRRPSSPPNLAEALDKCWPLHPITAALLGPSSRRKFGQNERSVFGFLTSAEPLGFREFLAGGEGDFTETYYTPAMYWNYLRANLESAILSSPDGHRWAISAEAVERVEARFDEPHVSLVKTAGLIELFRNGSGIAAETDILAECVPGWTKKEIECALDDLARASVLIYRKHVGAWGVFAGSDFDIEASVAAALQTIGLVDSEQLKAIAPLPAVSARRHYVDTGTLRWFEREVVPAPDARRISRERKNSARTGRFVLLLPTAEMSEAKADKLAAELSHHSDAGEVIFYGVPHGQSGIMERAAELAALEHVAKNKPELEGDSVARREVEGRLRQVRSDLASDLSEAFGDAHWYCAGRRFKSDSAHGLSPLASTVCGEVFGETPVIHSELVNRDVLSSSAAKAQRNLLHRMLNFAAQPRLGYEGFPADAGLYYTIVSELGMHAKVGANWGFHSPERHKGPRSESLEALWVATSALLEEATDAVCLADIYSLWRREPFGLKHGVMPVIALGFLLANRSRVAVYIEGTFTAELTDANVDEWLQDPKRISWKWVRVDASAKRLLGQLADQLEVALGRPVAADPLDSARALVSQALALPAWTQRTARVSEEARAVRTLLLRASDPIKVIFSDLPELLGTDDAELLVSRIGEVVKELEGAYRTSLRALEGQLFTALDHQGDLKDLAQRASIVQGITGSFQLDAFAGRLKSYNGSLSEVEGMVSLAVSKPPTGFTDHDLDGAAIQLAKWAFEFRQVEALATVQGRHASRQALAVVFGGGQTVSHVFDVSTQEKKTVSELAKRLLEISGSNTKPDIFLAALVEAGTELLRQREGTHD
jgi:hypothetical protein